MNDTALVSITNQGQITIPVKFREKINLKPGSMIVAKIESEKLTFTKSNDIFQRLGVHQKNAFKGKDFGEILAIEEAASADSVFEKFKKPTAIKPNK